MKHILLPISICSTLLLSGCLEVEDDSNDELVSTLQEQNQILLDNQQQPITVDINDNQVITVDLQGVIVDAYDDQPVTSAQISVKQGQTILIDNITTTNGEFQLPQLPISSDIEIIVSDINNAFMPRVFFVRTTSAISNGTTYDIGMLQVSEPVTVTIDVKETVNDEAYSELTFKGYSHSGTSSLINNYVHTSTFTDGIYTIVLPKYLSVAISANLDIDRDGEIDFVASPNDDYYNTKLLISSANLSEHHNVELSPLTDIIEEAKDVEYRISVIDSSSAPITDAELNISDSLNDSLTATYDDTTQQHVISAKFLNSLRIDIPSFTNNGVSYQSSYIQLSEQEDDELYVSLSNSNNNNSNFITTDSSVMELVIVPRVITGNSRLEVAYQQTEISSDESFSVFYSEPIAVNENNVSLTDYEGFSVVRGNEANDDLVLAGTTLITGNIEVPITLTLSLNNTKLTLTPQENLVGGNRYYYNIGAIEALSDGTIDDIYNDDLNFYAEYNATEEFNINDLVLDNENYTTNGTGITLQNTAGEVSSNSNNYSSVYIYFPQSIQSLNSFTLRKVLVTENDVTRTDVNTYNVVTNGSVNVSSYGILQAASNENIVRDNLSRNVIHGTTLADTNFIYRQSSFEYMQDDLSTSENSITFEYAYETKTGEVFTGNITLPVQ